MPFKPDMQVNPRVQKFLMWWSIITLPFGILLWVGSFFPNSASLTPGRVTSALQGIALALIVRGFEFKPEERILSYMWIPCLMIASAACFGYTSYLWSTVMSALFIYLIRRDLNHDRT